MQINTKFLLQKGAFGKKLYYSVEIIKSIRSKIIKSYKKLFGINEISQRKIKYYLKNNYFLNKETSKDFFYLKTKNEKSIALIVPCYMHERYIELSFQSIVSQTKIPDEVIFVNDFSKDNTERVLKKNIAAFSKNFNTKFKLINNSKNFGQSESINIGITEAESDLIMILNDDDYLLHDAIEVTLLLFQKNNELFMLGSSYIEFDNNDFLKLYPKNILKTINLESIEIKTHYPEDVLKYKNFDDLNMTHSGSTFYKIAWEKAGKYIPDKRKRLVPFSDRDFQLRLNALFPVGVSYCTPFVLWRNNSSVDLGNFT